MSWARCRVSADGTHHETEEGPLYAERFDHVLPFHTPGLAPVSRQGRAWHIADSGRPAYAERFAETFGFYGGRAAVRDDTGWFHILADGSALYRERYLWCGNYQRERCTVRTPEGYTHLTPGGQPISTTRWRYAGDYREGAAVVQASDGRHTHVDRAGTPCHGRWFHDLDVFHKGFARARQGSRWFHVDREGMPIYEHRFASVEPFYNGQARVETTDGGLIVIDTSGRTITTLRAADPFHRVSAMLVGSWQTAAIGAAVDLGLFDALPACTDTVAMRAAMPTDAARRLLDAMHELDLVHPSQESWHLTASGQLLRSDHPRSLASASREYAGPLQDAWRSLVPALRGERRRPAIFRDAADDPTRGQDLHASLRAYARQDYPALVPLLPIRDGDRVLDAAGGTGELARQVERVFDSATVTLADLPEVVRPIHDLATHAFDLFEPWGVQADVILLARVLHDWNDRDVRRILHHAKACLASGGRLCVLEFLRPDDQPDGALCDLHLLAVTGGRERRRAQWRTLLDSVGLHIVAEHRAATLVSVLVLTPTS